jgi:hypothetical protein
LHVEADAVVTNVVDDFRVAHVGADLDLRRIARPRVLHRVRQQVDPHLFHQLRIAHRVRNPAALPIDVAVVQLRAQFLECFIDQLVHANALAVHGGAADARERQQVVDQARHAHRGLLHRGHVPPLLLVELAAGRELEHGNVRMDVT